MDELMQQMADKFGDMVQAVIIEKTKAIDIDQTTPLRTKSKAASKIAWLLYQYSGAFLAV